MTSDAATAIVGPVILIAYLAFGVYGIRLERAAERHRVATPPRGARWDPQYYTPAAGPWLRKNRRWQRLRTPVWLGLPLLAWLLIRLLGTSPPAG